MSNSPIPTAFKPHTSEEDLGYSGNWRGLLSSSVIDRGVKLQVLSKKSKDDDTSGVLMPSFDWSMNPTDPAFLASVWPHMSTTVDPKKAVHFIPNPWATPWKCYTFQGPLNEQFFSPSNRAKMIGGDQVDKDLLADAFDDIYMFIKRNPAFDGQSKDYYLKKPDIQTDARVPLVERRYFSNMLNRDKEHADDTHFIELYTSAAYHYMIEQMRWATRFGGNPVDPKWPAYLIGDPTDPAGALVWNQQKMTVGGLKMDSNVICFTKSPEQITAQPDRRPISAEKLAGRINLYDADSWNWPTYQEMVEHAVEYWTEVPRDLIADACGHRATVPLRTKKATVVDGGGNPTGVGGAATVGGGSAPPQESSVAFKDPTPPPAAQPPTTVVAPAAEETMWVSGPVTASAVVKWTVATIREFAASGKLTKEKISVNNVWMTFEEAGFAPPAPAAAQEAPPAAPPAAPPEAPPEAPPAAPPAAASAPGAPMSALQAAIDRSVPTYHSMPPDKQERVREVMSKIVAHTAANPGSNPPSDLALELGNIMMG